MLMGITGKPVSDMKMKRLTKDATDKIRTSVRIFLYRDISISVIRHSEQDKTRIIFLICMSTCIHLPIMNLRYNFCSYLKCAI